jgi:peptidoglycan/LPS O-acetylase OafA/YrhL
VPEPLAPGQRYMPGLDGLRALAVLAVIAYHLGVSFTPGGLLGVGVFFTLSGYLISDILLSGWASGRGRLADFWLRRARRLLPALYVMLAVVGLWVALGHRGELSQFRGDALSAALYVNNWWNIFHHVSYFARFGPPSPLNHLWSLAIEEQFYLLWPWLLLGGLRLAGEPARTPFKPRLAVLTLLLAAGSAVEMALLYHPSLDPSRVYEATDTRAFGLMFGAALAMVWPSRLLRGPGAPGAGRVLDLLGTAGLVGIGLLVWRTGQYSPFLYHGGFVLLSLATVLVIAAAVHPASAVGSLLGRAPLRWIGVRSYGIYLWHVPVIVLSSPALSQGFSVTRAALQLAATFAIADLSWRLVESPVRRGALGAALGRARSARRRAAQARCRLAIAAFGALAAAAIAAVVVVRAEPPSPAAAAAGSPVAAPPADLHPTAARPGFQLVSRVVSGDSRRTSCGAIAHFGDSTSDGLNSPSYLPEARQRITAQYARVGARRQVFEIHGGDSIVEHLTGQPDMYTLAQQLRRSGYHGCWVLALGTNDSADVYVGSNVSAAQRIRRMMSVIGSAPVMWVNVRTLVASGPYAEANMQAFNRALYRACARYPNMRVFDWAAVARPRWFIADGIHYTTPGYRYRAELIADALARAFPAGGRSSGCLVQMPLPAPAPTRHRAPVRGGARLVAPYIDLLARALRFAGPPAR